MAKSKDKQRREKKREKKRKEYRANLGKDGKAEIRPVRHNGA